MPLKERVFTFLLLVESSYSWAGGEALACEVSVEIVQAEKDEREALEGLNWRLNSK